VTVFGSVFGLGRSGRLWDLEGDTVAPLRLRRHPRCRPFTEGRSKVPRWRIQNAAAQLLESLIVVRIRSVEPDVLRRTLSAHYLTPNSRWPRTAAQFVGC
jgi:hypothetical protein